MPVLRADVLVVGSGIAGAAAAIAAADRGAQVLLLTKGELTVHAGDLAREIIYVVKQVKAISL